MAGLARQRIYYDGDCGLCHGFVRFVLRRDREALFRFAPLSRWPGAEAAPDSVAVFDSTGRMLTRSDAVIHVLKAIGWRFAGGALQAVPRRLRDWGYVTIARYRRRLFAPPDGVCPVMTPELRKRFDL